MDEYYCPNCDAILNDQPGFDPDNGSWTCTCCGKHLMDDDVYEGDTYEGVAWYCDECDALLNRQSGFSDSYGTWTCTECGHTNGTTEDDIYESEEDYQYHKTVDAAVDFIGSVVSGIMSGIANASSEDDDEEDEDSHFCPNCNDALNEQLCFDEYAEEWTCTCCGTKLHRNYIGAEYEIVEDEEDSYYDDDDEDVEPILVKEPRQKTEAELEAERKQQEKLRQELIRKAEKEKNSKLRKKRAKAFIFKHKKIMTGMSSTELMKCNYDEARKHFTDEGFTNVHLHALKDIYTDCTKQNGEIEQITIDGTPFFDEEYMCPYDAEIIIVYHQKREFSFPYNIKRVSKLNYKSCVKNLQNIGFTNIYTEAIPDLITGWLKKDGSVEEITVDNNNLIKEGQGLRYDAKIVIKYHTFANKSN